MFKELLSNTTWSLLGSGFSRFATLVAHLITIRWLGTESYGIVTLVQTICLTAAAGIGVGMGTTATKILSEGTASHDLSLGNKLRQLNHWSICLAILGLVLVLLYRHTICWFLGVENISLSQALIPGSFLLIATAGSFYLSGILSGLGNFVSITRCNLLAALITIATTLVGISFGVLGIVCALAIGQTVGTALLYRACCIEYRKHPILLLSKKSNTLKSLRSCRWGLLATAFPLVLLQAVNAPADLFVFSILAEHPNGISEIGIFNGAGLSCQALRFLTISFSTALFPQLIRSLNFKQTKKRNHLVLGGVVIALGVSLPFILTVFLFDQTIISWFGPSMVGQERLLKIMVIVGTLVAIQNIVERVLIAFTSIWIPMLINLARVLLFCLMALNTVDLNACSLAMAKLLTYLVYVFIAATFVIIHLMKSSRNASVLENSDSLPIAA